MANKESNRKKTPKDLVEPLNQVVRSNQAYPTGVGVMLKSEQGILQEHFHDDTCERADRFSKLLDAEMEWIEKFTGHGPSVGSHYESLLRDLLVEYLPQSVKVGTGFVFNTLLRECSPQIDIVVYSDKLRSPIYRRGEFVVVDSESVIGVCEVKKNLTTSDLKKWISKTIGCSLGQDRNRAYGIQTAGLFAYQCKTSTKTLVKNIVSTVEDYLGSFRTQTVEGKEVLLGIHKLSVPAIYLRDREEFISLSVDSDGCFPAGKLSVDILKSSGSNGISPFLDSLTPYDGNQQSSRNLVSSYLREVVDEFPISNRISLLRRLGTEELCELFPDSLELFQRTGPNGEQIFGAVVSSFVDLKKHETLRSLSKTAGFSWQIWQNTDTQEPNEPVRENSD